VNVKTAQNDFAKILKTALENARKGNVKSRTSKVLEDLEGDEQTLKEYGDYRFEKMTGF